MRSILGGLAFVAAPYLWGFGSFIDRWLTWAFSPTPAERRKNALMLLAIWLLLSAGGLALSGCSTFTEYGALKAAVRHGVDTAIADRKSLNDTKTKVILELPCDASLGSVMRLENERQRAIIIELCGGPAANTSVTLDDAAALMRALYPADFPATPRPGANPVLRQGLALSSP